jgi:hypothetical protein
MYKESSMIVAEQKPLVEIREKAGSNRVRLAPVDRGKEREAVLFARASKR